jgi:hypothetical protein
MVKNVVTTGLWRVKIFNWGLMSCCVVHRLLSVKLYSGKTQNEMILTCDRHLQVVGTWVNVMLCGTQTAVCQTVQWHNPEQNGLMSCCVVHWLLSVKLYGGTTQSKMVWCHVVWYTYCCLSNYTVAQPRRKWSWLVIGTYKLLVHGSRWKLARGEALCTHHQIFFVHFRT